MEKHDIINISNETNKLFKRKKRLIMMNENVATNEKFGFDTYILNCKKGDLVETVRGEKFVFQKLARVNFVGKSLEDGKLYNVKIGAFKKILQICYEKDETNVGGWMKELKKDDMFYIVKNNSCILFKFVRHTPSGTVLALNPYNDIPTRIDPSFNGKKL